MDVLKTFDAYSLEQNMLVLISKACCTGKRTHRVFIPRQCVLYITDGKSLSILPMIVAAIGFIIFIAGAAFGAAIDNAALGVSATSVVYVIWKYFGSNITIHTTYGNYRSGCCVAFDENIFAWFSGDEIKDTGSHHMVEMPLSNI